jgi:CRP-like cAMP-binding protein
LPEIHPFAVRRILALRQFPILRDAELGELASFAENVTEVTLPAGSVVAAAGSRIGALHLVLEGEIATTGPPRRAWGPQQVFGALEVLAYRDASESAVATVRTTTLQLIAPDLTDLLEDSFGVLLATLRRLAAGARMHVERSLAKVVPVARPLGLVERLVLLRQQIAFSRAPLEALLALAHVSEEIALPAGTMVARSGVAGTSSYVIVEGTSCATHASGTTRMLGSGDVIGHLEALGNLPHDETIEVVDPLRALKLDASSLFDVIEDHPDFGRAILAVLADTLLAPQVTN